MTWIDLGNPTPRVKPLPYACFEWPLGAIVKLSLPTDLDSCDLFEVLDSRRTERTFNVINDKQLASLLWLCCRVQENQNADLGFPLSLRPCPSAGSIHPIYVIASFPGIPGWMRYEPLEHALITVPDSQPAAAAARQCAESVLDIENGVVLMFAAEPGKTSAKYANADSLVWRDAGVLLGYLSLISRALRLSFCPLGITGEPWVSQLDKQGRLIGVGMAIVGATS